MTVIAFVGSVFSPYYALARRRGRGQAENHCAINAAVYGERGKHWAMTERGRGAVTRSRDELRVGPSAMRWVDGALEVDLDEVTVPFPSRIRGTIRLVPDAVTDEAHALDARGQHGWWPAAPCARAEVQLTHPAIRWTGDAYFDCNAGDEPLEDAFRHWDWCRTGDAAGTTVTYDVTPRQGEPRSLALAFDRNSGRSTPVPVPHTVDLPPTLWRVQRRARTASAGDAAALRTLEDTPFYARSLIRTRVGHGTVKGVHETLSLDRFASRIVQLMLPFRMPRAR